MLTYKTTFFESIPKPTETNITIMRYTKSLPPSPTVAILFFISCPAHLLPNVFDLAEIHIR